MVTMIKGAIGRGKGEKGKEKKKGKKSWRREANRRKKVYPTTYGICFSPRMCAQKYLRIIGPACWRR